MSAHILDEAYKDFSRRIFTESVKGQKPTRAQFEITYRCNIHCVHCYTDPFNTPSHLRRELSVEEILRIFDQLAHAGVIWITLTGGEPFVHPRFRQIYLEAKQRGFVVDLYTNGTTITDDLAEFLATHPPFSIEVSCHAATPETFDRVTKVSGSFIRFQDGVQKLLRRNLPVKIKTKAMTVNRHELPEIKTFVKSLGLEFHLYTTIFPRLDGDLSSTQYRLGGTETAELELHHAKTPHTQEKTHPPQRSVPCEPPETEAPSAEDDRLFRCGCGTNTLTVSPYGVLRACTFTTWPQYDLRTMPVSEAFERMAQAIHDARYSGHSPCRTCAASSLCDKNPVMAQYEAGSMEAPVQHFCEVAFARKAKLSREETAP